MTRALWGKAKLEVYALKDEILTLKSEGSTIEEIYRAVADRLTIGQSTFYRHTSAIIQTASGTSKAEIAKPSARPARTIKPPSPPKPPVQSGLQKGGFVHKSDGASDALSAAYGEPQSPAPKPDKRKQSIDKT